MFKPFSLENHFFSNVTNQHCKKRWYLFLLLLKHIPEAFNYVQIDPSLLCVPLVPKRRIKKGPLEHGAKTSFLKAHPVNVIIRHHSPSCPQDVEPGLARKLEHRSHFSLILSLRTLPSFHLSLCFPFTYCPIDSILLSLLCLLWPVL